ELGSARIGSTLSFINSTFTGKLNMNSLKIQGGVFMRGKSVFCEVDMGNTEVGGILEMNGCTFSEVIKLDSVKTGSYFFMSYNRFEKDVSLINADIGGSFEMPGSSFAGKLVLNSSKVGGSLFMNKAAVFHNQVDMVGIYVRNSIVMTGSRFDGELNMNSLKVEGPVFMRDGSKFSAINLVNSKIEGNLEFDNSTFTGDLSMDNIDVGRNFLARYAVFAENSLLSLCYSNIVSTVNFSGSTMGSVDLTSVKIGAELCLGSGLSIPPVWQNSSKMILWNATVGALQDAGVESWPGSTEMEGFTYGRLGGFGSTGPANMAERKTGDFIRWLEHDKTFSPQPYEYLAKVLNEGGFPSKANSILHAGRKRSRRIAWQKNAQKKREYLRWFGLTLLQATIGYGLGTRYFRVLIWLLAFSFLGFWVLLFSTHNPNPDLFKIAWASVDVTLPIVSLNNEYEDFIFVGSSNAVKTWFYIQKMIGYVLGGFIVAGLAGLTQKNS
ncbi:MAG: hypothetical protein JW761_13270, partial [Prolixibacteraceae bacterium]|nr:hypothetical protein [Prolixibacteraceae bacterium]